MGEDEALDILWSHKSPFRLENGKAVRNEPKGPEFLYATTTTEVNFGQSGGRKPAGTRVIVTMVSRFGDVGVRATRLDKKQHGYAARVLPETLTDWSTERRTDSAKDTKSK